LNTLTGLRRTVGSPASATNNDFEPISIKVT